MGATKSTSSRLQPLIAFTIFVGAFLLFQIQPIVARLILPWFGSSAGVWAVSLMFFQVVLLIGYSYSHLLASRLCWRDQAITHTCLLVLSIAFLPVSPDNTMLTGGTENPHWKILSILFLTVGVPYGLLSATAPLLQRWFSLFFPNMRTYRLYALSNAGSLLGLLSYPIFIEPFVSTKTQTVIWSFSYFGFVMACSATAVFLMTRAVDARINEPNTAPSRPSPSYTPPAWPLWFGLSSAASALLIAITNQLTIDIAATPFLWVLPLALYLLSFIMTFESDRFYKRSIFLSALPLYCAMSVQLFLTGANNDLLFQVVGYSSLLFVFCLCCHGEIAKTKPQTDHLTFFFLIVSSGGAFGGVFVALIAPILFSSLTELSFILVLSVALIYSSAIRDLTNTGRLQRWNITKKKIWVIVLAAISLASLSAVIYLFFISKALSNEAFLRHSALTITGLLLAYIIFRRRRNFIPFGEEESFSARFLLASQLTAILLLLTVTAALQQVFTGHSKNIVLQDRNFYGYAAIKSKTYGDLGEGKVLLHGRILHGTQLDRFPNWPTSYFSSTSGAGLALQYHPKSQKKQSIKVGVIGLGAGTIASYANMSIDYGTEPGDLNPASAITDTADHYVFYEINPTIIRWAREEFSFLSDAESRGATVDIYEGDARLELADQLGRAPQYFDVLVLDAFSSDAIPMHLITLEAFELYRDHLQQQGILVAHISNLHLDLKPMIARLAQEIGFSAVTILDSTSTTEASTKSAYILLAESQDTLAPFQAYADESPVAGPLWTDGKHSLLQAISWQP